MSLRDRPFQSVLVELCRFYGFLSFFFSKNHVLFHRFSTSCVLTLRYFLPFALSFADFSTRKGRAPDADETAACAWFSAPFCLLNNPLGAEFEAHED